MCLEKNGCEIVAVPNWPNYYVCRDLLFAMRRIAKPATASLLGVIGKSHIAERLHDMGCDEDSIKYRRREIEGSVPCLIEAAYGRRPDDGEGLRVIGSVNHSPAIGNPFQTLGERGGLDRLLSKLRIKSKDPVVIFINLSCPRVEYRDYGKTAIRLKTHFAVPLVNTVAKVAKQKQSSRSRVGSNH